MDPLNQINIEETSTTYDIALDYHSDAENSDEDASIKLIEHYNGRVTFTSNKGYKYFVFDRSDPDRVIAIAQMLLAAAQMVKNNNKKTIDISKMQ